MKATFIPLDDAAWAELSVLAAGDADPMGFLREDQSSRWAGGQCVPVEEYIRRIPIRSDEDALVLILGEVILRREQGELPPCAEYQTRFPSLASDLSLQFELLSQFASQTGASRKPDQPIEGDTTVEAPRPDQTTGPEVWDAPPDRSAAALVVPGYEVGRELGRGGMGVILAARDPVLDREVAVKVLLPGGSVDTAIRRFVRESKITAALAHPGVPPVHELGELPDGSPYLAMKLIRGRTLADLLRERGTPATDLAKFVRVFEQVAETIGFAHAQGVIHRDLKPANVMVGAFGEVQVMDWGLAKETFAEDLGGDALPPARDSQDTHAGSVVGTPAYMAPEQARGQIDQLDARADVFALGGILCHVLTGRAPFSGKNAAEVVRTAAAGDLSEAFARLDGCGTDPELVALARRCLNADAGDRPGDGGEVAKLVEQYRAGVEGRLRQAETRRAAAEARAAEEVNTRREAEAREREKRKRRRVQLWLLATVLVFSTAAAGYVWRRQSRDYLRDLELAARKQEAEEKNHEAGLAAQREQEGLDRYRQNVERLLDECEKNLRAGDWPGADGTLTEAESQLTRLSKTERYEAGGGPRLAKVAAAYREDLNFAQELDRIDELWWLASRFGRTYSVQQYARELPRAFDKYRYTPRENAERIAASPVRDRIVAALDVWQAEQPRADLRPVLSALDPDPYRVKVRDAFQTAPLPGAADPLIALVESPEALTQPTRFKLLLAWAAHLKVKPRVGALLRAAYLEQPTNFAVLMTAADMVPAAAPTAAAERAGWYRAAIGVRPNNPTAWNNLGVALDELGKPDEAAAAFRRAVAANGQLAGAHDSLGQVLQKMGRPLEALVAFHEALKLDQGNEAIEAKRRAIAAEAMVLAEKAVAAEPGRARAHVELGIALTARQDHRGAAAAYRRAIALAPELAKPRTYLGDELAELFEFSEAVACYRQAIQLDPRWADQYIGLSHALYELGDGPGAMAAARSAIEVLSNSQHARFMFAQALFLCGRFPEARDALRTAQNYAPERSATYALLVRLEKELAAMEAIDAQLPALLAGTKKPARPLERSRFATLCGRYRQRYARAAGLVLLTLTDPKATTEEWAATGIRIEGAGYAVRAADGQGVEPPADDARAPFRTMARQWLAADLAVWKKTLAADRRYGVWAGTHKQLTRLLDNPSFAPVRDPAALANLPAEERAAWEALWAEMRATLARTRERVEAPVGGDKPKG